MMHGHKSLKLEDMFQIQSLIWLTEIDEMKWDVCMYGAGGGKWVLLACVCQHAGGGGVYVDVCDVE
jgi:hypothetical protein